MKRDLQETMIYEIPKVEVIEMSVEKGFANSNNDIEDGFYE